MRTQREDLVAHNYVVLEASALVQRRLGAVALREFHESLMSPIALVWVDEQLHGAAVNALLAARDVGISLVDRVSFALMRRRRIGTAFAFDDDFATQGFETTP